MNNIVYTVLSHLSLTLTLWGIYYYFQFMGEETETQELSNFLKVTLLKHDGQDLNLWI